jgi:hypothetical protein
LDIGHPWSHFHRVFVACGGIFAFIWSEMNWKCFIGIHHWRRMKDKSGTPTLDYVCTRCLKTYGPCSLCEAEREYLKSKDENPMAEAYIGPMVTALEKAIRECYADEIMARETIENAKSFCKEKRIVKIPK